MFVSLQPTKALFPIHINSITVKYVQYKDLLRKKTNSWHKTCVLKWLSEEDDCMGRDYLSFGWTLWYEVGRTNHLFCRNQGRTGDKLNSWDGLLTKGRRINAIWTSCIQVYSSHDFFFNWMCPFINNRTKLYQKNLNWITDKMCFSKATHITEIREIFNRKELKVGVRSRHTTVARAPIQ